VPEIQRIFTRIVREMKMAVNAYLVIDGILDRAPASRKRSTSCRSASGPHFGGDRHRLRRRGSAGRANFADLTVMKVLDKTPGSLDDCVTGDLRQKSKSSTTSRWPRSQEDYFKIQLADALITSIQFPVQPKSDGIRISFTYSKVKVSYNPEDDGAAGLHRPWLRRANARSRGNLRASRERCR
jgi:type VI secretion system secreted protein Hcp